MLENIKKILDAAKKGIVVMEDGKPSYVIMPFDDYVKDSGLPAPKKLIEKSDANDEEINSIIEKELYEDREYSIDEMLDYEDEDSDIKKDIREIKLEDLPF